MNKKNLFYFLIMSLFFFISLTGASAAEKYPTKEIQLVVPNQPGGYVDMTVRFLKPSLEKILGVPIVVDNLPAGGGSAGTHFLIRSKPDGYTIGSVASSELIVLPAVTPSIPFKYTDIDPLCKYSISPTLIFSKADAPWKTLAELVADAKKRPGQITYGATVAGTSSLIIKGFIQEAGINMLHIPMEAAPQTITRVLGGNVDIGVIVLTPLAGQVKAGAVRVFFLTTPERISTFPQIPTLKEQGYGYSFLDLYNGFFAPHGLPKHIRETLTKALAQAIEDPVLKEKLEEFGTFRDYLPTEAFARALEQDHNLINKIMKTPKL